MKSINIFACENGVGISRDIELIKSTLKNTGYEVVCSPMYRYTPTKKYDVNIFLERFNPKWFDQASFNCIVPNQEWFESIWIPVLPKFNLVLCKTRFAVDVFSKLGCKTEYISFTSEDRYDNSVKKDYSHWLHVAGKSVQKQTDMVIKTWANNPGFPHLTILQDPKFFKPRIHVRNINLMYDRLSDETLKHLQNGFGVHLCPSETEGFGHYIMEALSCKSVVISTDGPPMTELVTAERGFLTQVARTEPIRQSIRFLISEALLEKTVSRVLVASDSVKIELGEKSRNFFLENDLIFRHRLPEAIGSLFT